MSWGLVCPPMNCQNQLDVDLNRELTTYASAIDTDRRDHCLSLQVVTSSSSLFCCPPFGFHQGALAYRGSMSVVHIAISFMSVMMNHPLSNKIRGPPSLYRCGQTKFPADFLRHTIADSLISFTMSPAGLTSVINPTPSTLR